MKGSSQEQEQDRRVRAVQQQPENQQQIQQQQPQKCPRCESLNTKFCYYNNYSLSQPRYFCKTCRRYWTQGGTLRNVPVGGGCRKGKRPKRSSSVDHQPQNQQPNSSTIATTITNSIINPTLRNQQDHSDNMASPAMSMVPTGSSGYYSGGGFLPSLAAIQPFNQPINFGGDLGGSSSNLAMLHGFNLPSFSNPSSHHQQQVFQVGSSRDKIMHHLLPSMENVIPVPNRPSSSHHHHHHQDQWPHQSLINSSTNSIVTPDSAYWSNRDTTNHPTTTITVPSLNTSQWPDLRGYDPPPPPPSSSSPSFP